MNTQDQKIRVRIVDPDHPHYQEHGYMTGKEVARAVKKELQREAE